MAPRCPTTAPRPATRPPRRRWLATTLALALVAQAVGATPGEAIPPLEPEVDAEYTTGRILSRLERSHYRAHGLDDDLSARLFERYATAIDPARMFLLADDMVEFEHWRYELDDALEDGDPTPAYELFNRSTERRVQRLDKCLEWLDDVAELTFEGEETIEIDRRESPRPGDLAEATELWRLNFRNDVLGLRIADRDTEQIVTALQRRYENQRLRMEQLASRDVFRIWMNVVTRSFDPHTEYFPPRDAETFDIQMSLSFEGIGALLGSSGEYCQVQRIIPGGPAEADGRLQPMDRIVAVAQGLEGELVDVVGWRNDEIVDLIRGAKGTIVRLQVLPADQGEAALPKIITLSRDQVKLEEQAARSHVIELVREDGPWRVGVIELPTFYLDFEAYSAGDPDFKSATRDVAKLLEDLADDGVDGIVMDLRSNGGGSLIEARELTSLFLGGGPVVQIRDGEGRKEVAGAPPSPPLWNGPMSVLVNRLSASASEIFAAAIQDTGRGVVVGSRSFGKGTVQGLAPLGQGQLKITQAMFFRLSGGSTQNEGVLPDVLLPEVYDPDEIGESSLGDALPWESIEPVQVKRSKVVANLRGRLQTQHDARMVADPELSSVAARLDYRNELGRETTVSLNEAQRRAERLAMDTRLLEIENQRRASLDLEPVDALEDIGNDIEDGDADPFAREAAEILVDFIEAKATLRAAKRDQLR